MAAAEVTSTRAPLRLRLDWTRFGPTLLAAAMAITFAIWQPPSGDLAAAVYRSGLAAHNGLLPLYNDQWYGGHATLSYSVLAPLLGALIGAPLLAALAVIAGAALFSVLVPHRLAALWFAGAFAVSLLSGRVAFDVGVAVGLGALLAALRGRLVAAGLLAAATSLASPLAGAFLALAGIGLAPRERRAAVVLALAALVPIAALWIAFPQGGSEPFVASSFWPTLLGTLAVAAVVPSAWRTALVVYAAALVGAFLIPSAVGGNAARLAALFAGPLVAAARPRRALLLAAIVPLTLWQIDAPLHDFFNSTGDPATRAAYYAPLERFLSAQRLDPFRIEIPFTESHWEAAFVAPHFSIARGWERQVDVSRNGLFYDGTLTAERYHAWLLANAIRFVALPDTQFEYSGVAEAQLVRAGLPYLQPVFHSAHWRVFAVAGATPLASAPASMTQLEPQGFTLRFVAPGSSNVRMRFTPYWLAHGGCVSSTPDGYTEVRSTHPGIVRVTFAFSLARIFEHGLRCN